MSVVYYEYAEQERQRLAQIIKQFDQTINGLINGSSELRLLPAGTPDIKNELAKVDLMWREIQPILESTVAGNAVTKDNVVTVAQCANDMAVPLTMVLIMYLSI